MVTRALTRLRVEPGPDGVLALAASLPAALAGKGPALAPIPTGPAGYVDRVLAGVRPDDPSAPLEHDEVAVVIATSGSMSEPRGVLFTAENLLASARATQTRLGGPARWVLALPVHHVAGLQVLVRAQLAGLAPVPLASVGGAGRFSAPDFAAATRAAQVTSAVDGAPLNTALVPTQLARLIEVGPAAVEFLAAYDTILIGGAAAPADLVAKARKLGANIITTYGMTETSGGCVYDGIPLPGIDVDIASPDVDGFGRIEIAGPSVALGYRCAPEATAAAFAVAASGKDRVHRTCDIGRIDDLARLHIAGRIDDVVQVGGVNVSLAAVATVIRAHPDVLDAAVVATPDAQWGSRITAFVVPAPGVSAASERLVRTVTQDTAQTLGAAAAPREVVLVSALPILPAGKIDHGALRERAASGLPVSQ